VRIKFIPCLIGILVIFLGLPAAGISFTNNDTTGTFVLIEDNVGSDKMISLPVFWKSTSEDSLKFAATDYDDSNWQFRKIISPPSVDQKTVSGPVAWYRMNIKVDSTFFNKDVYLFCYHFGNYDLYLDGQKINSNYDLEENTKNNFYSGLYPDPIIVRLGDKENQLLAVRITTHRYDTKVGEHGLKGFFLRITANRKVLSDSVRHGYYRMAAHLFVAGLALAIAMIYTFLFIYYPVLKVNRFYALFTFSIGAMLLFVVRLLYPMGFFQMIFMGMLSKIGILTTVIFGTLIIKNLFPEHDRFKPRGPKIVRFLVACIVILVFLTPIVPREFYLILAAFILIHWIWMVIKAIRKGQEGVWFIGIGFLVFVATSSVSMLKMMRPTHFNDVGFDLYLYGILAMLIGMTLYLARRFAHINYDLNNKIDENRELYEQSLKHEREIKDNEINAALMEKELEEAREKQKMMDELERTNTELKNTQSQLVQSEKMASLGTLVAGVAHEINTPIGAISSMHDTSVRAFDKLKKRMDKILDEKTRQNQELLKPVQIIDDANRVISTGSERVAEIVRRLRSFARLDEAELQEADIHEGLEDTLMLVYHELKQRIEIVKDFAEIPLINCFPRQLNQVFLNVLMNASQAIKGKGTITISTKRLNGTIHISITDTGTGIDEKNLNRIFDPGFTTKGVGVGTGLGLSICYKIIEAHKGKIWATNNPNGGATFTIEIPIDLACDDIDSSSI